MHFHDAGQGQPTNSAKPIKDCHPIRLLLPAQSGPIMPCLLQTGENEAVQTEGPQLTMGHNTCPSKVAVQISNYNFLPKVPCGQTCIYACTHTAASGKHSFLCAQYIVCMCVHAWPAHIQLQKVRQSSASVGSCTISNIQNRVKLKQSTHVYS